MKQLLAVVFLLVLLIPQKSEAQQKSKPENITPKVSTLNKETLAPVSPIQAAVPKGNQKQWIGNFRNFKPLAPPTTPTAQNTFLKIKKSGKTGLPIFLKGQMKNLPEGNLEMQSFAFLNEVKEAMKIENSDTEFLIKNIKKDEFGESHIRIQQVYENIPVYGAEMILHTQNQIPFLLNGRTFATPRLEHLSPSISKDNMAEIALQNIEKEEFVKEMNAFEKQLISGEQVESELVVFHPENDLENPKLAWHVRVIPNVASKWTYIFDAHSGEILRSFSELCKFHNHLNDKCNHTDHAKEAKINELPPPPTTADANDLFGITRTINVYETGGNFFMIDASRSMHNAVQSTFPNGTVGVILTIDGNNTIPQSNNFETFHVVSSNNNWNNPTAVSAHYNGGKVYEYFKNTFGRESINGQGGNIISIINVADQDGGDMDNAFWNGQAMFYGNGDQAFTAPLAKALDVAAHEIGHGVIQSTANLEYYGESGALNESFADVFGAMVDRDDWQMGEDISNPSIFPTGALRDLSNPNNGGSVLGDPGYQPAHTNEQFFGTQDNGGVHINSGITNRAFFLFATDVGKEVAEEIYYEVLDLYLVKSSQFIDLRLAVVEVTSNKFGANSAQVNAAKSAFDNVGILNGQGNDTQVDVGSNPGDDFILFSNSDFEGLWIFTPEGIDIANPLTSIPPLSKPSVSDDGTQILYIAEDGTMQRVIIDWAGGTFEQDQIHPDAVWRNIAVAKDGSRIAALTDDFDNQIWVFDFGKSEWETFDLYNPTTANGGATTGEVSHADVLEFDFTGEWVMYDAYNELNNALGQNIDYWDIGFVNVFDTESNNWGDNFISKLFSGLSENVSVGNPTFSKNSDFIIAFDYRDDFTDEYFLVGANTETGDFEAVFQNLDWSFPNYNIEDDRMVFNAENLSGTEILAFIEIGSDKISAAGSDATVFLSETRWGTWFANGERALVHTEEAFLNGKPVKVYPNPFQSDLILEFETERKESTVVEVFNVLGQRVFVENFESVLGKNERTFNLTNLESGYYFLKINMESGSVGLKLLKE
ncbi:MAG: M4 family metallopeptidase [Saprospiraceae bacterium]|jgi:Zn-dependent metalloprotease|nr:M4 family metallopeptidase [Saprospiraceae bacterium]